MNTRAWTGLVAAILLSTQPTAWALNSHPPITINGDGAFTAANGVINPGAAGTAADPYLIQGWSIDTTGTGSFTTCIIVNNTTKYFIIRNNSCVNAAAGVGFSDVANGSVTGNSISQLKSAPSILAGGVTAITMYGSTNIVVSGNTVSNAKGPDGGPAFFGGGHAFGAFVANSSGVTVSNNTFSSFTGGAGGTPPGAGNVGHAGGDAIGVVNVGATNVVVSGNSFQQFFAGRGARGNDGASGTPHGGAGGKGGDAIAVLVSENSSGITNNGNRTLNLYAGAGGAGGRGANSTSAPGGEGGNGADGGSTAGALFDTSSNIISTGNSIQNVFGANGGIGGQGGFGTGGIAHGGNGGDGGNGNGLHYHHATAFSNNNNTTLNNHAGSGGVGGFFGGSNGAAGDAQALLID